MNIEKNILEISAGKKDEKEVKNEKYLRKEFSYSEFKRTFSLPSSVDAEKIKATHQNGVLTVEEKGRSQNQSPKTDFYFVKVG